jgi:DNA-binding response OmpR family regulator
MTCEGVAPHRNAAQHESIVLIVDDTFTGREVLASLLHNQGYHLAFAQDGFEALEQAAALTPDIILLDVMMPGMDGFEVCQRLRADPRLAEVPVIMVTALDDSESRLHGIEAGADDFVSKPFDRAELRARVRTVARLNRYRRLMMERTRFEWVVEHADDGYLVVDRADSITYANPQARYSLNISADEALPTDASFRALVSRHYRCEPQHVWDTWPQYADNAAKLYLVLPETATSRALWLRVDVLDTPDLVQGERLIRLRDITEQMELRRDIRTFHAMVHHKLRTPLVSLIGGLDTLAMETERAPEVDAELITIALSGAHRLQRTVQTILRYLKSPDMAYEGTALTADQLADIITTISTELQLSSVSVTIDESLHTLRLALSARTVEVILLEVLENACKFHPQRNPAVTVSLSSLDKSKVCLRICNDGPPLSPEQIARAFTPYYQGEKEFTGEVPGVGLGLATVASILWEVGGAWHIENNPAGTGVVVELDLPVCQAGDAKHALCADE